MTPGQTHNLRPKWEHDPVERARRFEVFRTPMYSFTPLYNYNPAWFAGSGFDPSAGDGRMIKYVVEQGNHNKHYLNDIREEELPKMRASVPSAECTVGDYLTMDKPAQVDFSITNPPFTLTCEFVDKMKSHTTGPVFILQSMQWPTAKKRIEWFRKSGLSHMLCLPRRPRWEMDSGLLPPNNVFGYIWYVFQPDYTGEVKWEWLN